MKLLERFIDHWQQARYMAPGDTVLLAVSGGPDSMAMLGLFQEAKIPIAVAHCNFGLRGRAADEDEHLVLDWCLARNIVCHARVFNTRLHAEERQQSIQEAAREIRYTYLAALCDEFGYAAIATAHHREDQAETMLMRLFQGAGINGLQGIPERNGRIIRPLLFASQKSLQVYLADRQIPFRIDASNNSDAYLRNRLRRHTLPALKKEFPDAVDQLNALSDKMKDAAWLYRYAIDAQLNTFLQVRGGEQLLSRLPDFAQHPARNTLLYEWLKDFGFSAAQTQEAVNLLHAPAGKKLNAATHQLLREKDHLLLRPLPAGTPEQHEVTGWPATVITPEAVFHFEEVPVPARLNAGPHIAFLDAGALKLPLKLRRWRTGDEFQPLGMKGQSKKLSDFFVDLKLSPVEKEKVWLLESRGRVVWVAGYRLDERFKISSATRRALLVQRKPL